MITSLLVANRGEIACRVVRTCRALGITSVAVYADADEDALHTRVADVAVRLPGEAPADTYLRGDLVVAAARAAGADAVHPGYGFLSENADFARAVLEAGLVWVGPPPEAIEAMASKTRAKELMGVPPPGDPLLLTQDDMPVLVKAAAGGGGRGMRVVRRRSELESELAAARSEARAAFGDGSVFVEPYVEGGRHVEVQLLADAYGTVWPLGTRDCSLQRRHQKVVEEAPAPGIGAGLTARLYAAAERAARATGYQGAGTVEFLVATGRGGGGAVAEGGADARGAEGAERTEGAEGARGTEGAEGVEGTESVKGAEGTEGAVDAEAAVHFLEMNTRLQVEHPVTEEVFGLDLVAWQIRIAEGRPLEGPPPTARGHAVEARLYAEDPARDWAPSTGVLHRLAIPDAAPGTAFTPAVAPRPAPHPAPAAAPAGASGRPAGPDTPRLRLDTGYADGDRVGVHYDALLAKLVAWAPTRAEAVRGLAAALERARVRGPVTNRELLVRSLRHPEFAAARMDTGFYDRHLAALVAPAHDPYAALAAALADAQGRSRFGGFRNVPSAPLTKRYRDESDGTAYEVAYRHTRDGLTVDGVTVDGVNAGGVTAAGERGATGASGGLGAPGAPGTSGAPPAPSAPSEPPTPPTPPTPPRLPDLPGAPGASGLPDLSGVRVVRAARDHVVLEAGGVRRTFDVVVHGERVWVGNTVLTALPRLPDPAADEPAPGSLLAPMPGTVVRLAEGVAPGARVAAGQPLLWLEAMKMEHRVAAPRSGTLTAVHAAPGDRVELGTPLAVVTDGGEPPHGHPTAAKDHEGKPQ